MAGWGSDVRDESNIGFSVIASVILAAISSSECHRAANSHATIAGALCLLLFVLARAVGIIFAFLVGILISLIEGSLVGAASMGLSMAYVLLRNIYTIRRLD